MKQWLLLAAVLTAILAASATAQDTATGTRDGMLGVPSDEKIPEPGTFVPFDTAPRQINDVTETWPQTAVQEAKVTVQYYVDKKGFPRNVHALKATPKDKGFEDAAVEMVKQMRFSPALREGKPVGIWVAQVISYKAK